MKKILLTGGEGQLAKKVSFKLKDNFNVLSLSKKNLNVTNRKNIHSVIKNFRPDIIINAAAYTNVDQSEINSELCYDVNAHSINNFSDIFSGSFLQISSDYIFDGGNGPYDEYAKPNPLGVYGKSKLLAEEIVANKFNKHTIIRANILFGGGGKADFLDWVISSLKSEKTIYVVDDQFNNPISISDMSKIIQILLLKQYSGIFHAGSDHICSRFDFAKMIAKTWNLDANLIKPISTNKLKEKLSNYIAERPLKSGLLSTRKEIPNFSLIDSLKKIRNNEL